LEYTRLALASLLADAAEEFSLTLWDNGSTDGTRDYLRDGVKDPRIVETVLSEENVGQTGAIIENDVFLGPSCVLTNITNPRSQIVRHSLYEKTIIRRGATVGANATIVCGIELGRYSFIAAGALVTKNVPDYALVMGVPGRQIGWMSRHGHRLDKPDADGVMTCPESRYRYKEASPGIMKCLDLHEESPLPADLATGSQSYDEFKKKD